MLFDSVDKFSIFKLLTTPFPTWRDAAFLYNSFGEFGMFAAYDLALSLLEHQFCSAQWEMNKRCST
jgi:hypothetical protein